MPRALSTPHPRTHGYLQPLLLATILLACQTATGTLAGVRGIKALSAGGIHCLALLADSSVIAESKSSLSAPIVHPANLPPIAAIAAGYNHGLALTCEGTLIAWGNDNTFGQTNVPPGLSNVVAIAASGDYNLALTGPPRIPPQLTVGRDPASRFMVGISTRRGTSYQLDFAETLSPRTWQPVATPPVPGNGSILLLPDPLPAGPARFFRVRTR